MALGSAPLVTSRPRREIRAATWVQRAAKTVVISSEDIPPGPIEEPVAP